MSQLRHPKLRELKYLIMGYKLAAFCTDRKHYLCYIGQQANQPFASEEITSLPCKAVWSINIFEKIVWNKSVVSATLPEHLENPENCLMTLPLVNFECEASKTSLFLLVEFKLK